MEVVCCPNAFCIEHVCTMSYCHPSCVEKVLKASNFVKKRCRGTKKAETNAQNKKGVDQRVTRQDTNKETCGSHTAEELATMPMREVHKGDLYMSRKHLPNSHWVANKCWYCNVSYS